MNYKLFRGSKTTIFKCGITHAINILRLKMNSCVSVYVDISTSVYINIYVFVTWHAHAQILIAHSHGFFFLKQQFGVSHFFAHIYTAENGVLKGIEKTAAQVWKNQSQLWK